VHRSPCRRSSHPGSSGSRHERRSAVDALMLRRQMRVVEAKERAGAAAKKAKWYGVGRQALPA